MSGRAQEWMETGREETDGDKEMQKGRKDALGRANRKAEGLEGGGADRQRQNREEAHEGEEENGAR